MIYKEHIESVIESLRRYANDKDTNLILLKNHLEEITRDITIEIEHRVALGEKLERLNYSFDKLVNENGDALRRLAEHNTKRNEDGLPVSPFDDVWREDE